MTDTEWPDRGTVTVNWHMTSIDGEPRLGWEYRADPTLSPKAAITLLRDVASELEIDLPDSN